VNTPTQVVITSLITDPTLIPGSVDLVRLDSNGTVVGVAGQMHDDGANGDAVAGDHVYSIRVTLNEPIQQAFALEVTAAFRGALRRSASSQLQFAALNSAGASLIDLTTPVSTIVSANVQGQQAHLVAGQINTDVTMNITQVLKGTLTPGPITVRVPGGILNGNRSFPPGTPLFSNGESVVLILGGPDSQGRYSLPDASLDVYHIQTSATLGQVAVVDAGYSDLDSAQSSSADFNSFLQRSAAGQATVSELYRRLGIP
jgi:hypothetical protein